MMATAVIYMRSSRRLSRIGWMILNRAREFEPHLPLFPPHAPTSWFMNLGGERQAELRHHASYLNDLVGDIRAAPHGFTEASHDRLLARRVVRALLVLQSVRTPGTTHQTCLMCESPVAESMPRTRNPARVSVEGRHLSSCGYWTLREVSIFPSLREGVDCPRLCRRHASRLSRALESVLGIVDRPVGTLELRHAFLQAAMEVPSIPEADSGASS